MKRTLSLALCLILVASFTGLAWAKDSTGRTVGRDYSGYHFAADGAQNVLTSSSSGVRFKNTAGADTFCLYGGPGSSDGKFDNGNGVTPDVLGHAPHNIIAGEWFGVDLTDQPTFWQTASSDGSGSTACFENLDGDGSSGGAGDGPGNQAWWAGQTTTQQPGWATAPGYGNNWNAALQWRQTINNPGTTAQTVGLTFAFNHDTEPAYDFFNVEYDSAATNKNVFTIDGANSFAPPGVQYPTGGAQAITYDAGAYAGLNNDEIVIRLTLTSDGAWSDEDGLWPTVCGGAVVDDITVTYNDGNKAVQVDFSDVDTTNSWGNVKSPFVGDFSQIHPRMTDIDPCAENFSPVAGFMDDGSCPRNQDNNGGAAPCADTGGEISVIGGWSYGIPGGWVSNFNGGLTFGLLDLTNEVWSPEINWDLPGTADDAVEIAGSFYRFTVWRHLPLLNGHFYIWNVRASDDAGATWTPPANRNFVYFSATGNWLNTQGAVTDLINGPFGGNRPDLVQLQLGVADLAALFAFPGNDATPSPAFDNAGFFKYELAGPVWATRNIDLMMQAFPQSGQFQFHTFADRQTAGCRIDMRDISSGSQNFPGDSTIVDVVSAIPGFSLVGPPTMEWIMDKNPKFDDVRSMPAGTTVIPAGALNGWDQWRGSVLGQQVIVNGTPVNNGARYFADLYDGQPRSLGGTLTPTFAFPGDVIRWYWRAEDTGGRVTTLPANINGFDTGRTVPENGRYAANFTLKMLPTIVDDGQGGWTQPWILLVNDFGFRGGLNDYWQAFDQNGWTENQHYDIYTTWGPTSSVSNAIGSVGAHGATPDQLSGYQVIVYVSGDLGSTLISDGSNSGNNDKGDDLATLNGWFTADDDRYIAHFGDDIVSALLNDSPGPGGAYVQTVMGASLGDNIVKDEIDNQSAPRVVPAVGSPWFTTDYIAYGGCAGPNEFDSIDALVGAARSHEFVNGLGVPYGPPNRAGSVTFSQLDANLNEKVSITFPYGFVYVWDPLEPEPVQVSKRSLLLKEIIEDCFGHVIANPNTPTGIGDDTPQYSTFRGETLAFVPNPFNPKTTISFEIAQRQDVEVAIYNIRGEKVTTLHRGVMDAGVQSLTWNGVDGNGVPVSSGVYLVKGKALSEGKSFTEKITLLK